MLMPSKNTAPIQMLKSLHSLAVLKPFYCKNRSIAAQNDYHAIRDKTRVLPLVCET